MGRPVLGDHHPGGVHDDTPTRERPPQERLLEPSLWEAHLGFAASDLHDLVADGQEQLHDTVRVPLLGLHQGLAQGQPHVTGQEVLAVFPGGPASPRRCPWLPGVPHTASLRDPGIPRDGATPQPGIPGSVPDTRQVLWAGSP